MIDKPILLEPRVVPRVWGGRKLATEFGRELGSEPVGESWEIHGELRVEGDSTTLDELVETHGQGLLGRGCNPEAGFPLLMKWLDCKAWLSVQVHPDDELAREFTASPQARGKTEAWYVHKAEPDAELIHGLADGVGPEQLKHTDGEQIVSLLKRVRPDQGQMLYTSAGVVHALGPGNLIYEVQQSCDITYRFYDWGRDRETHFEKALQCVERATPEEASQGSDHLSCRYFSIQVVKQPMQLEVTDQSFEVLAATASPLRLSWSRGEMEINPGRSVLLPAGLGVVRLAGSFESPVLRIRVPEAS